MHVPARLYSLVLTAQLDGPVGITFQVHKGRIPVQSGQGKHLVHHLKHQGGFIKGKALGDARFGEAVFTDLFNVHSMGFGPVI